MGEALGSASEPSEINSEEWRSALSGAGVYFEYTAPVRLSVLDGWLGARMPEMAEDVEIRRVCVVFGEDRSRIYYEDCASGLFYGADTASSAGKAQELEIYSPNGALFAFESGIIHAENAPYTLIMQGREHPDINTSAAGSAVELLDITLTALGHSNELNTTFTESDGTLQRIGTQFRIRAELSGRVLYRRTDIQSPDGERPELSESEMIEMARAVAADTIGKTCGGAEVFFESFEPVTGDTGSVVFGYYIAGGRVNLIEERHAARVTFRSGVITDVELDFRNFTLAGELTRLLPERQAFAAAEGEFMLCYPDSGAEVNQPAWVIKN